MEGFTTNTMMGMPRDHEVPTSRIFDRDRMNALSCSGDENVEVAMVEVKDCWELYMVVERV